MEPLVCCNNWGDTDFNPCEVCSCTPFPGAINYTLETDYTMEGFIDCWGFAPAPVNNRSCYCDEPDYLFYCSAGIQCEDSTPGSCNLNLLDNSWVVLAPGANATLFFKQAGEGYMWTSVDYSCPEQPPTPNPLSGCCNNWEEIGCDDCSCTYFPEAINYTTEYSDEIEYYYNCWGFAPPFKNESSCLCNDLEFGCALNGNSYQVFCSSNTEGWCNITFLNDSWGFLAPGTSVKLNFQQPNGGPLGITETYSCPDYTPTPTSTSNALNLIKTGCLIVIIVIFMYCLCKHCKCNTSGYNLGERLQMGLQRGAALNDYAAQLQHDNAVYTHGGTIYVGELEKKQARVNELVSEGWKYDTK
jgi:hypothetical protein